MSYVSNRYLSYVLGMLTAKILSSFCLLKESVISVARL